MTKTFLTLPRLFTIDAATCAAMGVVLASSADFAGSLTGLPAPLLSWAGVLLLPIAAFIAVVARMAPIPLWAINLVILGNAFWALASTALPLSGAISPSPLGWLFLLGQTAVVVVLTLLERGAAPHVATA